MLKNIMNSIHGFIIYVYIYLLYKYMKYNCRDWRIIDKFDIFFRIFRELVGEDICLFLFEKIRIELSGHAVTFEHEIFDGEIWRYVHGRYTPDRNSDGPIVGFIVLVTDISERRILEMRLRHSEKCFNDAFHSSAIYMEIVVPDGSRLDINNALNDMLAYSRYELQTLNFQKN